MQPFISIIIPTFNEEKYIGRLLSNLANQNQNHFEVILVDGGSSDMTLAVTERFRKKLPLTILSTKLKNVAKQRNLGAKKARGEYLCFYDADVQVTKNHLRKVEEFLQKKRPDYGTTHVKADSKNFYDKVIASGVNIGSDFSRFTDQPFIGGWNFIIKKSIFFDVKGFREDIVHGEDFELATRLYKHGYKPEVIRNTKLVYCLRRYRKAGRVKSIGKNVQAYIYSTFKGPITKDIFVYPMGGGWYNKSDKNKTNTPFVRKAKKFIKKIQKLME